MLAASNLPWDLDMALLRRLEKRILVPLPSHEARLQMLAHHLPQGPQHPSGVQAGGGRAAEDVDFSAVAEQLDGYSGSDIKLVCKEAAMKPLRRLMAQIEDLEEQFVNGNVAKMDPKMANPYHRRIEPTSLPGLGQVTGEDIEDALNSTKAAAKVVNTQKYEKWMEHYGSM